MRLRTCAAAFTGLALMGAATTAEAAPAVNPSATKTNFLIQKAACWGRHCGYSYGPRYHTHGFPNHYRTGSNHWWNEMDREGRGGRR